MGRFVNGIDLHQDDFEQLASAFGINETDPIHISEFGGNPDLFLIRDDGGVKGKKLLKRYWRLKDENVPKLEETLLACSRENIIPFHFSSQKNSLVYKHNGSYYSLMTYIDTETLNPENKIPAIATAIANMHRILAGISHDNIKPPLAVEPKQMEAILRENKFDDLLSYINMADQLKDSVRLQLVHNDLYPGNIIASVTGEIFIVDFESFSANPLVADILFAAFRLAEEYNDKFYEFLRSYEIQNPLSFEEKRYGLILLAADFIRKLGFILTEHKEGNDYFLKDYEKYSRYVKKTTTMIRKNPRGLLD